MTKKKVPGIEEITLRDFFATYSMQLILKQWLDLNWDIHENIEITESIASEAYLMADAMIEERKK